MPTQTEEYKTVSAVASKAKHLRHLFEGLSQYTDPQDALALVREAAGSIAQMEQALDGGFLATTNRFRAILNRVYYAVPNRNLLVRDDGSRLWLQVYVIEDSIVHKCRKWYLSKHMTDSEFFQTALLAVLTAEEHEIREKFLVDGVPVFGPHIPTETLVQTVKAVTPDARREGDV